MNNSDQSDLYFQLLPFNSFFFPPTGLILFSHIWTINMATKLVSSPICSSSVLAFSKFYIHSFIHSLFLFGSLHFLKALNTFQQLLHKVVIDTFWIFMSLNPNKSLLTFLSILFLFLVLLEILFLLLPKAKVSVVTFIPCYSPGYSPTLRITSILHSQPFYFYFLIFTYA